MALLWKILKSYYISWFIHAGANICVMSLPPVRWMSAVTKCLSVLFSPACFNGMMLGGFCICSVKHVIWGRDHDVISLHLAERGWKYVGILYDYNHNVPLKCRWSRGSTFGRSPSRGAKRCWRGSGSRLLLGVSAGHAPSLAPLSLVCEVPPPNGPPLSIPQYLHSVQQPLALCCLCYDQSFPDGGIPARSIHFHHAPDRWRRLDREAISAYIISSEWECVGPADDDL